MSFSTNFISIEKKQEQQKQEATSSSQAPSISSSSILSSNTSNQTGLGFDSIQVNKVSFGLGGSVEHLAIGFFGSSSGIFDCVGVCKKIVDEHRIHPEKAKMIVDDLCKSNDVRFNNTKQGVGKFNFNQQEVINELNKHVKVLPPKIEYTEHEKKIVAMQLVSLVERQDVELALNNNVKVIQKACHAEIKDGKIQLSKKQTSASAELPKLEKETLTLANTASLALVDNAPVSLANTASIHNGTKVICFRSAKTHTELLQMQRSHADIVSRIEIAGTDETKLAENGIRKIKDSDEFEYQPLIFTMMDGSALKALGTSLPGLINQTKLIAKGDIEKAKDIPIENEKNFLEKMKQANVIRFSSNNKQVRLDEKGRNYILHLIETSQGKLLKVREYPAIIQNHIFSSQSKNDDNRAQVFKDNLPGQMQMLKLFVKKDGDLFEGTKIKEFLVNPSKENLEAIAQILKKKRKELKSKIKRLSVGNSSKAAEDKAKAVQNKSKWQNQRMVLQAFYANITGNGITKEKVKFYNQKDSGADLAMLTGIQADYLGLSFSIQCKSGNDRTISAVSSIVANDLYLKQNGEYFNPEKATDQNIQDFKHLFSQSVITFGFSNAEASRGPRTNDGKSGLKIGSSPSALKYLDSAEVAKFGEIIDLKKS